MELLKRNYIYLLLLIYAILSALTITFFDGTGDSGDSIRHFLFAKYAPLHPELFFNHWAKPLYVLLASPFAQFGFIGIKIFNAIVSLLTIFFTFKTSQKLNINNSIISAIIVIFSPLYFILTFSGLTEPLFALFIIVGIYTILLDRYVISSLLISFLPFIRSEGLIIIGIFGIYLLIKRKWKIIPLLIFGHIAYSIAGFFVYNDFFWIFNKIPYARLSSTYGQGELTHFIYQLFYVVGAPIYILFYFGIFSIIWKSIKGRINIEIQVLVFLGFILFFTAHTLFWYLGIFNSMGLKRVFLGVIPLMSIISLMGFNFVTDDLLKNKRLLKLIFQGLLTAYIIIFPFTSNPAAINWERDLSIKKDQQSAVQITEFLATNRKSIKSYIYAPSYISNMLNIDHFDDTKRKGMTAQNINNIEVGDIIIWENWFSVVECGISKQSLDNNNKLVCIYNLRVWDNGRELIYAVYEKK